MLSAVNVPQKWRMIVSPGLASCVLINIPIVFDGSLLAVAQPLDQTLPHFFGFYPPPPPPLVFSLGCYIFQGLVFFWGTAFYPRAAWKV
jgi:hypothetical protein